MKRFALTAGLVLLSVAAIAASIYDPLLGRTRTDDVTGINIAAQGRTTLTISGGVVTASNSTGYAVLRTEGAAATDDLDTINGGTAGKVLFLVGYAGETVTLKHATGNIYSPTGLDYQLFENGTIALTYDGTKWRIPGDSGSGGGTATWGYVGGTLSNQTDLAAALAAKAAATHVADTANPHSTTAAQAGAVPLAGNATKTDVLTFGSFPVLPGTMPTADNHAANKTYVDTVAAGLSVKASVVAATAAAGTLASDFENGDAIDTSVTLVTGDRILIKDQAAGEENGIYVVEASGAPTRASDYNTNLLAAKGTFVNVIFGTANANTQWVNTTTGTITLGVTPLVFSKLSAQTSYTASLGVEKMGANFQADLLSGGGLELTGNELGVNIDDSSIGLTAGELVVKASGVTNTMLAGSIADTKLSTISTAGKVSGAALTSLSSIPGAAGLVPAANLGTGTADSTTALYGDGVWRTISTVGLGGDNVWSEFTITGSSATSSALAGTASTNSAMGTGGNVFPSSSFNIKADLSNCDQVRLFIFPLSASNYTYTTNFQMEYSLDGSAWRSIEDANGIAGLVTITAGTAPGLVARLGTAVSMVAASKATVYLRVRAYTPSGTQSVTTYGMAILARTPIATPTLDEVTTAGATTTNAITTGAITSGANGADGAITVYSEQGGTDYGFTLAPHDAMTETTNYRLPSSYGTADYALTTDGAGQWYWAPKTTVSAGLGAWFYMDDTAILAVGANNDYKVATLTKVPVTTAEDVDTVTANNNVVMYGGYLYDTALGVTTIPAGEWLFNTYAAVSSATAVSEVLRNAMRVRVQAETVTITGTGTSRTATASGGTPFAEAAIDASATQDAASYIQTPLGLFQITARTSDTEVTVTVPSGYTNESTVAFNVWKKLFQVSTGEVNALAPAYTLYPTTTVQSAFTVLATDKLAELVFVKTTRATTTDISFVHNGTAHYSNFRAPLKVDHGDLGGLTDDDHTQYSLADGTRAFTGGVEVEHADGLILGIDAATNTAGKLKLWGAGSNNYYTTFETGTQTQNVAYTLPLDDGASGQGLKTDGSGVLSWGDFGVTGFTSALNTAAPNATNNVSSLTASGGTTNQFLAIVPKGTGGITAAIPDSTATGGNVRGNYSVDLQTDRSAATMVASGVNSVICGGYRNTASGGSTVVIGGDVNVASGSKAVVLGGNNNTASGDTSSVLFGNNNTASGTLAGAMGSYAAATLRGQVAHASNAFALVGDAQTSVLVPFVLTSDATPSELWLSGVTNTRITIASDRMFTFRITVSAVDIGTGGSSVEGDCAGYQLDGVIRNLNGTTALVGSIIQTVIAESQAAWDATAEADNTNDALVIKVTGEAAKNIRWVARVELTEIDW